MQSVKPYGHSVTRKSSKGRKRLLKLSKPAQRNAVISRKGDEANKEGWHLEDFSENNPRYIMSLWISTIDKILSKKPESGGKLSLTRDKDRKALGEACWKLYLKKLQEGHPQFASENKKELKTVWDARITSYDVDEKGASPSRKGRLYKSFFKQGVEPYDQYDDVAQRINTHIWCQQVKIGHCEFRQNSKGLLKDRAASVEAAVRSGKPPIPFYQEEFEAYRRKLSVDFAKAIHSDAQNLENENKRIHFRQIAAYFHDAWAEVFIDEQRNILSIAEAKKRQLKFFELHQQIKDYYKRTLSSNRKQVARILPADSEKLGTKLENQAQNLLMNDLIYRGKIIHYHLIRQANGDPDKVQKILEDLPSHQQEITNSTYHLSAGQQDIKRSEAFVRVWRRFIGFAAHSLDDWVRDLADGDSGKDAGDILMGKAVEAIKASHGFSQKHQDKGNILFGKKITADQIDKDLVIFLIRSVAKIRNNSFHFKDFATFIKALDTGLVEEETFGNVKDRLARFYHSEQEDYQKRLLQSLEAIDLAAYFSTEQVEKIIDLLLKSEQGEKFTLPKFAKIMDRRRDGWPRNSARGLILPAYKNRRHLIQNSQALSCQYQCLSFLYDRPFRSWVAAVSKDDLQSVICTVLRKTAEKARRINGQKSTVEQITSKAEKKIQLQEVSSLSEFLQEVSAVTARDFAVQDHYNSNSDNARKQSDYLEKLKQDVILLLFDKFLKDQKLKFICDLLEATSPSQSRSCSLLDYTPSTNLEAEDWEIVLYAVLNLAPVTAVNDLLHQLYKWETLSAKAELHESPQMEDSFKDKLMAVLRLYVNQHDAKLSGGLKQDFPDFVKSYYREYTDFRKIFDPANQADRGQDVAPAIRALREINRFGWFDKVEPIFKESRFKVGPKEVNRYFESREKIAGWQQEAARLHEKIMKRRGKCQRQDFDRYRVLTEEIAKYRDLSNKVLLKDHRTLHHLSMEVLARFCDYAGLWERDIYFSMLARLLGENALKEGADISDIADFAKKVAKGRIVEAYDNLPNELVKQALSKDFGIPLQRGSRNDSESPSQRDIRNDFAHFNMLREDERLQLTDLTNKARQMMDYDRKLKNSVTKSIIHLLSKYGVVLSWHMDVDQGKDEKKTPHLLRKAQIKIEQLEHLKGKKTSGNDQILEKKISQNLAGMIEAVFADQAILPTENHSATSRKKKKSKKKT